MCLEFGIHLCWLGILQIMYYVELLLSVCMVFIYRTRIM